MPKITTKEATIDTFQVEIQTLRVNNKQVTMGLFRQLPFGRLIDPKSITFNGIPWGHVQYWWDGDGRQGTTTARLLHVVWQHGDTLYRAIVNTDISLYMDNYRNEEMTAATAYVLRRIPMCTDVQLMLDTNTEWLKPSNNVLLDGKPWTIWLGKTSEVLYVKEYLLHRNSIQSPHFSRVKHSYHDLLKQWNIDTCDLDVLLQRYQESRKNAGICRYKWESRIQELYALPQLFIAV